LQQTHYGPGDLWHILRIYQQAGDTVLRGLAQARQRPITEAQAVVQKNMTTRGKE
jgi:hypothetical protein